ncbi:MAG: hypothetical protein H6577_21335 [Lewinellaceae bacterium]|nr:hypothetical protein [Saprospiraceae bacterium]MCB9340675.1 hypothetical protein [Lewinellaceae bacterium]
MKKNNLRSITWAFLIAASLSSYIYLHVESVKNYGTCPSAIHLEDENFDGSQQDSKVFLPDIALVKKILNITKIVLPKN